MYIIQWSYKNTCRYFSNSFAKGEELYLPYLMNMSIIMKRVFDCSECLLLGHTNFRFVSIIPIISFILRSNKKGVELSRRCGKTRE